MNDTTLSNLPQNEIEQLVSAARDALTDSMVERLSVTAANAMELVDRLNDEETRDALHHALDRLSDLHRLGALDTLFDLVTALHAARSALTDGMVERLATFAEQMVGTIGSEEVGSLISDACTAVDEAAVEAAAAPVKGGLFATLSMLSKPETQRSLHFLLGVGERLRKRGAD